MTLVTIVVVFLATVLFTEAVVPRQHPVAYRTRIGLLGTAAALTFGMIVVLTYT